MSAGTEDTRQSAEVLEMFYMLGVMWVHKREIHQAIQLGPEHFTLCKFYFNKKRRQNLKVNEKWRLKPINLI